MSETVRGLKLVGWQQSMARLFESLEPTEKLVVKSSRQKGKSTMMLQILLYCALNHPRSQSYYVSPTNNQCRKQFNELRDVCEASPLVSKLNESILEVRFTNRSVISFVSAEAGEHLRGNTVKNGGVLIIDECAFIKDETIAILLPYVTVHKANIIAVSTPRRTRGTFYDWWTRALAHQRGYKYIDVNQFDNSFFISDEQIEDYKKILSPEKFKNEILGMFSDSSEGVFGDYTSHFFDPADTNPVYLGIDWSTTGEDSTVVSGFNSSHQQCLLWTDSEIKDPVTRLNRIANLINMYPSIRKIVVEKNSIGAVYSSMLKKQVKPQVIEFVTTNSSKKRIIDQMIARLGKDDITLLNDPDQDYEMSIFTSIPTRSGNDVTYAADPLAQNSHDDIILATAFAIDAFAGGSGSYSFGNASMRRSTQNKFNQHERS